VDTTFVLIPGAGGAAWYWHRVVAELEGRGRNAVAVQLPAADESAGLAEYTEIVVEAMGGRKPIVLVAQSMGGFTAPLVCARVPVGLLVLVNAMVPKPGETGHEWWTATGWEAEAGEVDFVEAFFHDVPADVREAALAEEPPQSATPFDIPWPLASWRTSRRDSCKAATTASSRSRSSAGSSASAWGSTSTRFPAGISSRSAGPCSSWTSSRSWRARSDYET
jgi:hypothetical protein